MSLFSRFRSKKPSLPQRGLTLLGLDGVPVALLKRLASNGTMPNIGSILAEGRVGPMRSSLPAVSSVNWTSFMTGVGPAQHGIFGFTDRDPGSYRMRFPNADQVRTPPFWDKLGRAGKRSAILNQPSTYPARPMEGVLIAGFVAPRLEKAVWPPERIGKLKEAGYRIDADVRHAHEDLEAFVDDLKVMVDRRFEAFSEIWDSEPFDFFEAVATSTDRLQHFAMDAVEDEGHPTHGCVMGFYSHLDAKIGALYDRHLERWGEAQREGRAWFMMMSDHGFTPIKQEVYLNALLVEWGMLQPGDDLEKCGPGSRAFSLDPGRIFLNDPDKEALGREIAQRLLALRWEGQPVVRAVHRREAIYEGPLLDHAADLIAVSHPGFDLKGALGKPEPFGRSRLTGMHTEDDAFFYDRGGSSVEAIDQIAPIILDRLLS